MNLFFLQVNSFTYTFGFPQLKICGSETKVFFYFSTHFLDYYKELCKKFTTYNLLLDLEE